MLLLFFFLTKSDLHKHSLKCLIYSTIRVAKTKDQLRDYSEADLRLCFRIIMQIDFFYHEAAQEYCVEMPRNNL